VYSVRARSLAVHTAVAAVLIAALILTLSNPTAALAWWKPPQQLSWYWQLAGTVNNSYPAAAYDVDGFDNGRAEVSALHAAGKHVICYIDVGTWENWRTDANKFPGSVLGNQNGWPGERWLDIRQLSTLEPIMAARFQMCRQKGFDAVEPDNIDGWENSTGFPISAQDQLTYDEWVAREVHALGLAVLQKNDPEQATQLQPYFDGVLDEQCNEYQECSSFATYLSAGKPVLNAEYNLSTSQFCASDNRAGIMGALFNMNLDGTTYQPCWSGSPGFGTPRGRHPAGPPRVEIAAGAPTDKRGATAVRLTCPRGQSYCNGTVEIVASAPYQRAGVLGRQHFQIPGGRRATVKLALSPAALRTLARASAIPVSIRVVARNQLGQQAGSHRTTTLRLPSGRRRA
jgi:hypothetical protein